MAYIARLVGIVHISNEGDKNAYRNLVEINC
jgi:hypothetical protein